MREEEKRKVGGGVKQKGRKGTNERTNGFAGKMCLYVCESEVGERGKKKGERREGKGKRIRKQRRGSSFSVEMVALLAHTSDRGRFNIGWHRLV